MLFEGHTDKAPERYQYGDSMTITLSGVSFATRMMMSHFDPVEDYTGTLESLLDGYVFKTMSDTSGGFILNLGYYALEDQDVGWTTATDAVNECLKILGPQYWAYMDHSGGVSTLIVGARPKSLVFEFDDSDIIDLNVDYTMGIITRCQVIGFDEDATYTATATGTEVLKHGENTINISSGMIKTHYDAMHLAFLSIEYAQRSFRTFGVSMLLNPNIQIGHQIRMSSAKANLYTSDVIYEYSHSYQQGQTPTTTAKCYYLKLENE
jgi:hypothetical protein